MLGKKTKSRIYILILSFISIAIIIFLILKSLEENVVYFFSPTEIYNKSDISFGKKIRLGGLVKEGSTVGLANGILSADGKKIYSAENLKVGLFK